MIGVTDIFLLCSGITNASLRFLASGTCMGVSQGQREVRFIFVLDIRCQRCRIAGGFSPLRLIGFVGCWDAFIQEALLEHSETDAEDNALQICAMEKAFSLISIGVGCYRLPACIAEWPAATSAHSRNDLPQMRGICSKICLPSS